MKIFRRVFGRGRFGGSRAYWERRYAEGGNSGAGSSGQLAEFKAGVLNRFVAENDIERVVELGCGDGGQLSLAEYPQYLGLDVSRSALEADARRFKDDPTKSFLEYTGASPDRVRAFGADLALSLDVIYHLVEDEVFHRYMTDLFEAANRFVIIYSSNVEMRGAQHVRHREFTRWVAMHATGWNLRERIPNRFPYDPAKPDDTSLADFYVFEKAASP